MNYERPAWLMVIKIWLDHSMILPRYAILRNRPCCQHATMTENHYQNSPLRRKTWGMRNQRFKQGNPNALNSPNVWAVMDQTLIQAAKKNSPNAAPISNPPLNPSMAGLCENQGLLRVLLSALGIHEGWQVRSHPTISMVMVCPDIRSW